LCALIEQVVIESREALKDWLDQNFWLEDGNVEEVVPVPENSTEHFPSEVSLEINYQLEGGYEAGGTRRLRCYKLRAIDIREWSLSPEGAYFSGNCMQGAELIEVEKALGLSLDVPGDLRLVCTKMFVTQLPDRLEPIAPWVGNDLFAEVAKHSVPSPADWVR
jgi:hypothetical protein